VDWDFSQLVGEPRPDANIGVLIAVVMVGGLELKQVHACCPICEGNIFMFCPTSVVEEDIE
jgi:hypothetical protein